MARLSEDGKQVILDTTELWIAHHISYAIHEPRETTEDRLRQLFQSITNWAKSPECRKYFAPKSNFFYLYYSIVLHLGAAVEASIELKQLGHVSPQRFIKANRCFIECCSRLFSAIDLIVQLQRALDCPEAVNKDYNKELESFKGSGKFSTYQSRWRKDKKLRIGDRDFELCKLIDILRNKQVHRIYNYVVPIRFDNTGNWQWRVFSPELSCAVLDAIRDEAERKRNAVEKENALLWHNPWEDLEEKYFFPNDGKSSKYKPAVAFEVPLAILKWTLARIEDLTNHLTSAAKC